MTVLLALVFVLALMGGLLFLLKRLGLAGAGAAGPHGGPRRLRVVEVLPLSPQHRAVLLKRDNIEHLVVLGPNGQTVVEQGIPAGEDIK